MTSDERAALEANYNDYLALRDALERAQLEATWEAVDRGEDPIVPDASDDTLTAFQERWRHLAQRIDALDERCIASVCFRLPAELRQTARSLMESPYSTPR